MGYKFIFWIFLLVFINSCQLDTSTKKNKLVEQKLEQILSSWKFESKIIVNNKGTDLINLNILFLSNGKLPEKSYFLDTSSNQLIVQLLLVKLKTDLNTFRETKVLLSFQDFPGEIMEFTFLKNQYSELSGNITDEYVKNVSSILSVFRYDRIAGIDSFIKFLYKERNFFNYSGSFWHLLYGFSNFKNFPEVFICDAYSFKILILILNDSENDLLSNMEKDTLFEIQKQSNPNLDNSIEEIINFYQSKGYDFIDSCL